MLIKVMNYVCLVFLFVSNSDLALAESVVNRIIVIESFEFEIEPGIDYQPDAPMVALGEQYWLKAFWDKTRGGITHIKTRGPAGRPFAQLVWIKTQSELFRYDRGRFDGNLWIVNNYRADDGILAFVHVENAEGSGLDRVSGKHLNGGKSRIGLAWSANGGETFTYLGSIIVPHRDPEPFNIQGTPYLVLNGYFYVYFHDVSGLTVARASVVDVLSAARKGVTSPWKKYDGRQAGFSSDALGGHSMAIGIDGISHTDAACSTLTHKCYLLLSRMNWGGHDSWLKLFESSDGVHWTHAITIAQEKTGPEIRGYQYCTIINEDGNDNASVDQRFYVYCDKDHPEADRTGLRWEIELICIRDRSPC